MQTQLPTQLPTLIPLRSDFGLLRVVSGGELDRQEKLKQQQDAENDKDEAFETSLAAHIRRRWEAARNAKQLKVEPELLASLRQRKGQYEPDLAQQIRKEGGSDVFIMLTDVKCRAAESWIKDILQTAGDRSWLLTPTPVPDISPEAQIEMMQHIAAAVQSGEAPPEMMQQLLDQASGQIHDTNLNEANAAAERMTSLIEDQLVEGEFQEAFSDFIFDVVTYPAAFLKGPILKRKKTLKWGKNFQPVVGEEISIRFERISPFDVYPDPDATSMRDGIIIKHRLTPTDISQMRGVPGSSDEEIDEVLEQYGRNGLRDWLSFNEQTRETIEGRNNFQTDVSSKIDALEFRGMVQGSLLVEWGMDPSKIQNPLESYDVEAWLVGRHVIRCVLNGHPLGDRPLHKASAVNLPGSFWGMGIPQIMRDAQKICNASVRSLVDNMAFASGPQVGVDAEKLCDGEKLTNIYPLKVWALTSAENGKLPIDFFQPTMNAGPLLEIFDKFSLYADQVSGIPAYTYGGNTGGGAAGTASGLSMLMGSASKGIKQIISNVDQNVVERVIEQLYLFNMLYCRDPKVKGDLKVRARGAAALIQKETTQMRRMEFLDRTANPIDMSIIGIEGRAELLRETSKALDMPSVKIVPTVEELRAKQEAQQQMAQEQMMMQQGQMPQPSQTLDPAGNTVSGQAVTVAG